MELNSLEPSTAGGLRAGATELMMHREPSGLWDECGGCGTCVAPGCMCARGCSLSRSERLAAALWSLPWAASSCSAAKRPQSYLLQPGTASPRLLLSLPMPLLLCAWLPISYKPLLPHRLLAEGALLCHGTTCSITASFRRTFRSPGTSFSFCFLM